MNKGIGSSLLKKAESEAKKDRKKRLVLMVDGDKKKNVGIYKRRGFKRIASEKGRKHNGGPSLWVLMAKDVDCPGSKIRSKGKGRGLGRGKGKGPLNKHLRKATKK